MLAPGSNAPDFTLSDQFDNNHTLSEYKGKWVVLYFYPKDMTPGCTTEACNFRDDFPDFQKLVPLEKSMYPPVSHHKIPYSIYIQSVFC